MNVTEEIKAAAGRSKKSRGSVRNKDRLEAFGRPSSNGKADWGTASEDLVASVVVLVTALGGAVIFGTSRDGGAHLLTLMLDDKRKTLWFNGDSELDDELRPVVDTLSQLE